MECQMKKLILTIIALCMIATPTWAADSKLSALTELAAAPAGTDQLYINDGGVSKRVTVDNLYLYSITYFATIGDLGIGKAAVAGAQLTLPQEADMATPTLAFGDGNTGISETANDKLEVGFNGATAWTVNSGYI